MANEVTPKVFFAGAGPGAKDLITVRGMELLKKADCVVFAGSLIPREMLEYCPKDARLHDSASLTHEQVIEILVKAAKKGSTVIRLHSGDPSIYGAIGEQIEDLEASSIEVEVIPGVSSFLASAAALKKELTLPEISQTIILTRAGGRTPVPDKQSLKLLAAAEATYCIFLSVQMIEKVVAELLEGGLSKDTPAAVIVRASREDQKVIEGDLTDIVEKVSTEKIKSTAMIIIGEVLAAKGLKKSKLYDASFTHGFRDASK